MSRVTKFKMSEEITTKEGYWENNGNLRYRSSYKNKKLHSLSEWWNNGNPYRRINYKDGKRHGLYERWYNGNLMFRINYKDGKRHGLYEEWYENGNLYSRKYYFNGEEVTEFEFDVLEESGKSENE